MKKLFQWISEGEHQQQDFKETISSAQKIAKTIVAFANTNGGRLLIGVRDNGTIRGIRSHEERYMIESAAGFFAKPPISVTFELIECHENKAVLVVNIAESEDKPHYWLGLDKKWWAYIRVKDKSLLASKTVLEVLKKSNKKDKGVLIQYTDNEKKLLTYLQKNEKITLKQFCKLVNISHWRARKILVNLVQAEVIRIHTTEKTSFYTLA